MYKHPPAIRRQGGWRAEVTRFLALSVQAQAAQVLARICEELDAVVRGAHPDAVLPVHTDADGPARDWLAILVERRGPEAAGIGHDHGTA